MSEQSCQCQGGHTLTDITVTSECLTINTSIIRVSDHQHRPSERGTDGETLHQNLVLIVRRSDQHRPSVRVAIRTSDRHSDRTTHRRCVLMVFKDGVNIIEHGHDEEGEHFNVLSTHSESIRYANGSFQVRLLSLQFLMLMCNYPGFVVVGFCGSNSSPRRIASFLYIFGGELSLSYRC